MKYFVISKNGEIHDAKEFLKKESHSEEFNKFVRREAFDEILVEQVNNKPEYLKYAAKLGFSWEENAGIGLVNYDYKANFIMKMIKEYANQLVQKIGFPIYEVQGSNMFDASSPVVQAYANLYGERLFNAGQKGNQMIMSYDASYPQFNLAGKYSISHRDLPFGHFSISDCYRYEQSGECMMFYRQRRFYMPDLHPYFKNVAEAFDWYPNIEKQILEAAKSVNRKYEIIINISSNDNFEKYKKEISQIAVNNNQDVLVGIYEDNKDRYWIINVDYKVIDKLGHSREIGCIQIDIGNAQRLGIQYIDEKDQKQFPVIIHAAVPGGIERFIYMIFDDFKNCMPIWLYPIQLRLIPVSDKYINFCEKLAEKYKSQIRIDIDDRAESVSKKIKEAHKDLIPNNLVIGEKEINGENLEKIESLFQNIIESSKEKPFMQFSWPKLVSRQIK